jgi:hypothetical protein
VFGRNTFIAYSEEGDACFTSNDLGQTWLPCATAAQGGSAYLFDGRQWVAATSGAYLTSPDANAWTRHPVALMPRRLLFDGTTYFGRSEDTHYRASTLTAFEVVATRVPDFRAWTLGRVLAENLPVLSPAACVDHR